MIVQLFLSNFCVCFHWRIRNYENLNKMHVKLNLLLLLLLFPNFTDHSHDISQKLPRVQCTVNSNGWDTVIATFTYWCIWHRSPASNISKTIVFHKKRFFKKHIGKWDSVTTLKYHERYSWYSCQISRNEATTKLSCMRLIIWEIQITIFQNEGETALVSAKWIAEMFRVVI